MTNLARTKIALRNVLGALCLIAYLNPTQAASTPGKIAIGELAPTNLGVNRDGEVVDMKSYLGKVVVVTFWASWCGPCKKELPVLEGVQRAVGKDRIQVIAVNIEEREQFRRVSKALEPLALMLSHDYRKIPSESYGVKGIPHMVIIGKDGKVQKVHRGYSEEMIDSLVDEINAALSQSSTDKPSNG